MSVSHPFYASGLWRGGFGARYRAVKGPAEALEGLVDSEEVLAAVVGAEAVVLGFEPSERAHAGLGE
jgi:hypothetical protein